MKQFTTSVQPGEKACVEYVDYTKFTLYLLGLLSQYSPLADEIRRRSMYFARAWITNELFLVRAVTSDGIRYGRYNFCTGQNVLLCLQLYDCQLDEISRNRKINKRI